MAVVKTHLAPGQYQAQGKPVDLNAASSKAYADKFRALKAQGVKFGVPWGHFEEASPGAKQFLSSRFNAGYVEDLLVGPDGGLDIVLDCPGVTQGPKGQLLADAELPDGTKVKTAISEVSPGIWDNWRDGKGVLHENIVGHVALAMMPVVANQSGFTGLSTLPATNGIRYLSSTIEEVDEKEEKPDVEAKADDDPPADESDIPNPLDLIQQTSDQMKRVLGMFAEAGMALPPDTDESNFLDRVETGLGVLLQMVAKINADKAKEAESNTTEAPLVEEQGPGSGVMMSTLQTQVKDLQSSFDKLKAENKKYKKAFTKTFMSSLVKTDVMRSPADQPNMVTVKTAHGSMEMTEEQAAAHHARYGTKG